MSKLKASKDKNWFGQRLKAAREAARMSQEELAEKVELTRLTIARYESGRLKPGFERLEPLAAALSQPLWWFFTDRDEKPKLLPSGPSEELCREILVRLGRLEEKVEQLPHFLVEELGQAISKERKR